jgi:hypothetical protein
MKPHYSRLSQSIMSVNLESEATIDPVAVIRLVRQLLTGEDVSTSDNLHNQNDTNGRESDRERSQEDAGCMLWDLSTIREAASIMSVSATCTCCLILCLYACSNLQIEAV